MPEEKGKKKNNPHKSPNPPPTPLTKIRNQHRKRILSLNWLNSVCLLGDETPSQFKETIKFTECIWGTGNQAFFKYLETT